MQKTGCVSAWFGSAKSEETLRKYIEIKYDLNGDLVQSPFMKDFNLEPWDEGFREMDFRNEPVDSWRAMLAGFSYDEILIPQIEALVTLPSGGYKATILLYDYAYSGLVGRSAVCGDVSLFFAGQFQYHL